LGLVPPSTPGYDLVTREGKRVQVKTLRCTPENLRGSIGVLREPCDLLVALRLNDDFTPLKAMEIPREVVEQYFGQGRVGWQKRLAAGSRVRVITGEALLTASRSLR
jgi:hypothetical protein